MMSAIGDIEAMYELAASGCLTANDAEALVEQALKRLAKVHQDMGSVEVAKEPTERLTAVETMLRNFHPNGSRFPLSDISSSEVDTYRKVFGAVAGATPSPRSAREIIDAVLKSAES